MGVSGPLHNPATPGKDPVSIIQEAEWAPALVQMGTENLVPVRV